MEYKEVRGFPDYVVREDGEVFRKVRKFLPKNSGYHTVKLINTEREVGSGSHTERVYRLVTETFLPNPYDKEMVNHKDGNTFNDHVSNLEWVTRGENVKHGRGREDYYDKEQPKLAKGNVFKSLRIECGMSRNEVTRHTGIAAFRLQRIENHEFEPYQSELERLAKLYDVDVAYFFERKIEGGTNG